jgi:hypothetical protein
MTQKAPAINHTNGGVLWTHPNCSAKAQTKKHNKAPPQASQLGKPFRTPHSQAPAVISNTVKTMKGHGFSANKAGSSRASKISAVITLCLSMFSPEKKAAKGRPVRPW